MKSQPEEIEDIFTGIDACIHACCSNKQKLADKNQIN
jgi:hypothetical protein